MSISSLTGVALARNVAGTTTKADAGEVPQTAGDASQPASLSALLVKQVPTGMVASYTAVTAVLVELATVDGGADNLLAYRWAAFAVLVLGSVALAYVSYIGKAGRAARFPAAELIGVAAAAAGWGLVIPESPVLAQSGETAGIAFVTVTGFVATIITTIVAKRLQSPA